MTIKKRTAANAFLCLTALILSACGTQAKSDAPAATVEALLSLEEQANAAYVKANTKFFEARLSDKFILAEGAQRLDRAAALKMIGGVRCEVKSGHIDEPHLATIDADTYAFSYRTTWDGTCTGPDGNAVRIPSPVRAATIWIRNGNKWQANQGSLYLVRYSKARISKITARFLNLQ